MGKAKMVDGDGWISEESSYYGRCSTRLDYRPPLNSPGDEEEKDKWEDLDGVDSQAYWKIHSELLNTKGHIARSKMKINVAQPNVNDGTGRGVNGNLNGFTTHESEESNGNSASTVDPGQSKEQAAELYNPYKDMENARQLSETVPEFLTRVSPMDIKWTPFTWIWIADPYDSRESRNDADVPTLDELGNIYLAEYLEHRKGLETANPGMVAASITRKLKTEREELKQKIQDLAKTTNVLSGKVCTS